MTEEEVDAGSWKKREREAGSSPATCHSAGPQQMHPNTTAVSSDGSDGELKPPLTRCSRADVLRGDITAYSNTSTSMTPVGPRPP